MSYKSIPIKFKPTLNPEPDETNQNTVGIIDANNIRFFRGGIEKIGGHAKLALNAAINGVPRAVLTFSNNKKLWTVTGTHTKLYARNGGFLYNITPLKTTAAATLGTDPLSVTNASKDITVTYTAHGLAVGDRLKLTGATDTGGILAANINREFTVSTVVNANNFKLRTTTAATSAATGGGASIQIFKEIDGGGADAIAPTGPWIGSPWDETLPPWTPQTDYNNLVQPRIWWMTTFGETWIGGTGQSGKCYYWNADTDVAPQIISNAPNASWGWVEGAKLCLLDGNTVANSNTGDYTAWTPSEASSAYSDDKEDALNLISQIHVNGENYVFDEFSRIFRLRWVGGATKWVWEKLTDTVGIVSPYGRTEIGGIVYMFGQDNIYYINSGIIAPLPNNTLYKYIYTSFNTAQKKKCFLWYNAKYNELWGHYPSQSSSENDRCFIFNLVESSWNKRTGLARTAYDAAGEVFDSPLLASPANGLYQHEIGYNDDGAAMDSWFQVSYQGGGKYFTEIEGMELDAILTGAMTITLYGKDRPNSAATTLGTFAVSSSTLTIDCTAETRLMSWKFDSNAVNGYFRIGAYRQFISKGAEF